MRRAFACLLLATLTAATPPPSERVIAPDGKATLSVNGIARTVLIDPAALGIPIITKDYAQAASMKPGMIEVGFTVGPVKLEGKTAVAEIQAGTGATYKRRIAFTERPFAVRPACPIWSSAFACAIRRRGSALPACRWSAAAACSATGARAMS